jgi:type I restriction enzyme S subunit
MEVKPGYKQTEVGVIPEEWKVKPLGQLSEFVTSGSRGWAKHYSDRGPLFVRSQNIRDGRLDFTDRQCVIPPAGSEGSRTRLDRNDLLVTITGNSVGNVAWVERDLGEAYISQHVGLVRLLDPSFAEYANLFLAPGSPGNRQIWASQSGQSKPGLTLKNLEDLCVALPSPPEQRAIVTALRDLNAPLGALDRLIAKKRDLKQAAMQQLLTGQTRLPGFVEKWVPKKFGDLLKYERPDKYMVKSSDYLEMASTPVLTANKSFVLGYTDEWFGIYDDLPVIIFDDFTTDSKYVDFLFKVKSSAIKLLKTRKPETSLRFIFERMRLVQFPLGEHKRYYISEYQHIEVPTPDPDEQAAIAAVLTDMDADLVALEQRLTKAHALKQGMMQELLTGKTRLVSPEPTHA